MAHPTSFTVGSISSLQRYNKQQRHETEHLGLRMHRVI